MKKQIRKFIAVLLVLCSVLSFVSCGNIQEMPKNDIIPENSTVKNQQIIKDDNGNTFIQLDADADANIKSEQKPLPKGEYNEGVVLVKFKDTFDKTAFGELTYTSAEALYEGSKWYTVNLADKTKTEEAVKYLTELGKFENVDYDYVMGVTADLSSVDVSCNPDYGKQKNHNTHKIPDGWQHIQNGGKYPGGSSDVVVAVIDTGVDYNHLDLRNNIWVNNAEIPNNRKDDDGNGYVDDIYGWDCVGNDNNPIDDNGHGTHVAGIIAAENNEIGGVGIAYGCKIMVLKAGNSSGYFNNSDIAEAIKYAYMNGASVINMSFGGSQISVAVEEALESAYNSCVLVAAAGNDGACNNLYCQTCEEKMVCYPAALPFVIGVMSTNHDGSQVSSFSNYDHNPYSSIEYEVYAVGEKVPSCWPNNKYADLNGTSMAAPTVSGIAALLRSAYPDRETYSTKFIQSQIVNTGTMNPYNSIIEKNDEAHSVTNVYEALTKFPKPEVNLYDYSIDDSTTINAVNNGNGVIDAGETVRLYFSLQNRGGVASDVNVSIDTGRGEGLTDPYFTFVNPTMQLSDIGTYSVRESGDKYFEIIVSADCPNDYLVNFNIKYTYKNGMDEKDTTVYKDNGEQKARFNVSSGYHLPGVINEDTTFTNDRLYIISENVIIPSGVTVTFEEGCRIQFYDDRNYYDSPAITVYGTLNIKGEEDNMVLIYPNERHATFSCLIDVRSGGVVDIFYADTVNLFLQEHGYLKDMPSNKETSSIRHSYIRLQGKKACIVYSYDSGAIIGAGDRALLSVDVIDHCYVEIAKNYGEYKIATITNCYVMMASNNSITRTDVITFKNNFLLTKNISNSKGGYLSFVENDLEGVVSNNIFSYLTAEINALKPLAFSSESTISDNFFNSLYREYADQIISGYYDSNGNPKLDVYGSLADSSLLWPYVVSVELFDKDGNPITTVGREEITVRVTFNRPMDKTKDTFLTFGTIEPYAAYKIEGSYISDTVWEGSYTLKAQIENGQNFLKVNNACAAEDPTKTVFGEYQLYEFTIDTTAAMSMNLQAIALDEGIELTFAQDDYDTLLGYNIYRSEEKDGNYVKLNTAILLPNENTFLDENAQPGKTYWYTYTVVLSDFTESKPAGKVQATAKDTMAPSLYHTPVNQGYENNNLVVSCTASDNVEIQSVTLYYRAIGTSEWEALNMSKNNDKYSATIFGSDVTLAGLEYYIVAQDTLNAVQKGSAEVPYTIVVKSADSLLGLGDLDGNGTVTTKDALMLMQCINGDLILSDDQFKRADLNKDGVLSSVEALRILQYVNGKVTTLEM